MGFHYEDAASRWGRGRPLSTEASYCLSVEIKRPAKLCSMNAMKWRSLEESSPGTDIRPLREIFAERKELIAKYVPAETQAVHARAVAELKQQRVAANILSIGAKI